MIAVVKEFLKRNRLTSRAVSWYIGYKDNYRRNRTIKQVQRHGLPILSEVTSGLYNTGILAFADFGTLLGIVRENSILKHDIDVDISVISRGKEDFEIVERFMIDLGFHKKHEYVYNKLLCEQSYEKNGIRTDICFYVIEKDLMSCYLFYQEPGKDYENSKMSVVRKTYTLQSKLKEIIVDGYPVLVPLNPERLLEEKYGKNWRIPDKGWVYWDGPNTMLCNGFGIKKNFIKTRSRI